MARVGFIGLGNMGGGMAANLAKAPTSGDNLLTKLTGAA